MSDIFISYVEEDACIALEVALHLEEAGYTTWCYELDALSGSSYAKQVVEVIGRCRAFLILISQQSTGSIQVDREMNTAFQDEKLLVPVQYGITYEEFMRHRPDWRYFLGSTSSVTIPSEGVEGIMPLAIGGLKDANIDPMPEPNATRINRIRKKLGSLREPGAEPKPGIEVGTKDYLDTSKSLNKLAELYIKQRNYTKAWPLLNKALEIQERALGPDHPEVAKSLNNLAEIYIKQKMYAKALPLLKRAEGIAKAALGPTHPTTKQIGQNMRACKDKRR